MDEKAREIEKLNLLLGSAGEEMEKVESRIATILGVSGQGLTNLRSELNHIRTQVINLRSELNQVQNSGNKSKIGAKPGSELG